MTYRLSPPVTKKKKKKKSFVVPGVHIALMGFLLRLKFYLMVSQQHVRHIFLHLHLASSSSSSLLNIFLKTSCLANDFQPDFSLQAKCAQTLWQSILWRRIWDAAQKKISFIRMEIQGKCVDVRALCLGKTEGWGVRENHFQLLGCCEQVIPRCFTKFKKKKKTIILEPSWKDV